MANTYMIPLQGKITEERIEIERNSIVIDRDKLRMKKGNIANWDVQVLDADGVAVDLTDYDSIKLNMAISFTATKVIDNLSGTVLYAAKGLVRFAVTAIHTATAATYVAEIKGVTGVVDTVFFQFDVVIEDTF